MVISHRSGKGVGSIVAKGKSVNDRFLTIRRELENCAAIAGAAPSLVVP